MFGKSRVVPMTLESDPVFLRCKTPPSTTTTSPTKIPRRPHSYHASSTTPTCSSQRGRHQRRILKKFLNLNMFWNGKLHRHLNRWERGWTLYHNPLHEDQDCINGE